MASKSSKTLFSLLIIHLFALSQCKPPFKISRMSHVARSTKFRGDIHKGKCRCKLVCLFVFFFSYQTFYNGHVCLIPKIPNLITCLYNSTFFTLMASSYAIANLWERRKCLHKKKGSTPRGRIRTTTRPPFIVFGLWTLRNYNGDGNENV